MRRPKEIKSFDQFTRWLQGRPGIGHVAVQAVVIPIETSNTVAVGELGTFGYCLEYAVVTQGGKRSDHRERLFSVFHSTRGFADAEVRERGRLSTVLAAEQRVGQLSLALAGVETYVADFELRPYSPAYLDTLHLRAQELGAVAPDLAEKH